MLPLPTLWLQTASARSPWEVSSGRPRRSTQFSQRDALHWRCTNAVLCIFNTAWVEGTKKERELFAQWPWAQWKTKGRNNVSFWRTLPNSQRGRRSQSAALELEFFISLCTVRRWRKSGGGGKTTFKNKDARCCGDSMQTVRRHFPRRLKIERGGIFRRETRASGLLLSLDPKHAQTHTKH